MNLRRLLMKAQEQGVPVAELAAEVEDPGLATSWDFLDSESPNLGYVTGAMTDATKRRHEAVAEAQPASQLPITGRAAPAELVRTMPVTPFPPSANVTSLPTREGISDLTICGATR